MNKIKTTTLLILSILWGTFLLAESQVVPLTVSCNLPLSGELSVYGATVEEGVRFFQESLPEEKRNEVQFDWQDNEGKGIKTVSVAKMQLQKNPDVYVSGVKPQYMAIESILGERSSMPNFAWVFDSFLREKNKNNFRTWVSFKSEAELFLKSIEALKNKKDGENIKRVAIIYVITPTVVQQQETLVKPGLEKLGLVDNLVIPYQMDQLDFKTIALKVKNFKPDIIFLSGFQHNMTPLVRSFRALSLIKKDNTFATYDLLDSISLMKPEEIHGIRFTMPAFLVSKSERMEKWKSRFRERFKREPLYTHIYAHEMASILYDMAERHKEDRSKSIMSLLSSTDMDGLIGRLKFDENGDIVTDVVYGSYEGNELVEVKD